MIALVLVLEVYANTFMVRVGSQSCIKNGQILFGPNGSMRRRHVGCRY